VPSHPHAYYICNSLRSVFCRLQAAALEAARFKTHAAKQQKRADHAFERALVQSEAEVARATVLSQSQPQRWTPSEGGNAFESGGGYDDEGDCKYDDEGREHRAPGVTWPDPPQLASNVRALLVMEKTLRPPPPPEACSAVAFGDGVAVRGSMHQQKTPPPTIDNRRQQQQQQQPFLVYAFLFCCLMFAFS